MISIRQPKASLGFCLGEAKRSSLTICYQILSPIYPYHHFPFILQSFHLRLFSFWSPPHTLKLTSSAPCVFCQGSLTLSSLSVAYPPLPTHSFTMENLDHHPCCVFLKVLPTPLVRKTSLQWQRLQFIHSTRVWVIGGKSPNGRLLVLMLKTRLDG